MLVRRVKICRKWLMSMISGLDRMVKPTNSLAVPFKQRM